MIPRPKEVKPIEYYKLEITFNNGEKRIYDMNRLLETNFYRKLKNKSIFNSVKVSDITLEWVTGEDICPEEIYHNSIKITE